MRDHDIQRAVVFRCVEFLRNRFNKWNAGDLLPLGEVGTGVEQDEFGFILLDECVEFADALWFVCGEIFLAGTLSLNAGVCIQPIAFLDGF